MTLVAPHITAYLRERLPNERKASPLTTDTYAYAFQLLFQFASQRLGCSPAALQLEQLDAPLVLAFLEHLQADRRNGPSTRNARLAAIKSFMHFLGTTPSGASHPVSKDRHPSGTTSHAS
jgi:integrase/recombinase XerD